VTIHSLILQQNSSTPIATEFFYLIATEFFYLIATELLYTNCNRIPPPYCNRMSSPHTKTCSRCAVAKPAYKFLKGTRILNTCLRCRELSALKKKRLKRSKDAIVDIGSDDIQDTFYPPTPKSASELVERRTVCYFCFNMLNPI
jgi:hypothetical protein